MGAIKCDPVTGCICDVGWTGTQCNIDVDECGTATSPCTGNNTVCVNNPGSYVCDCQTGYKRNGLNECASK